MKYLPGSIALKLDKKTHYLPLSPLTIPGLIYLLALSVPEHLVRKAQTSDLERTLVRCSLHTAEDIQTEEPSDLSQVSQTVLGAHGQHLGCPLRSAPGWGKRSTTQGSAPKFSNQHTYYFDAMFEKI